MIIQKGGCVYILTNQLHTVYYTGVTSDLQQRMLQHLSKLYPESFTAKYNCNKLVWYESFAQISEAILREKQIKNGSRSNKTDLIHSLNPEWNDLWESDVKFW